MKKTLNLLAALMLTFTFAACSFFEKPATGGSKISIALDKAAVARIRSTSASVARAIDNTSGDYYFTVSLQGDYQDEQTVPVTEEAKVTFKAVPVGKTISAQAQVYLAYTGEDGNEVKEYLYTGTSEELTVAEGENPLTINLQKYVAPCNTVIKTATKFIAINPTFTVEHDGRALATNKLEFNYQANDETMVWKLDNLSDYQKAIVTFKGDVLKTDEDNVLAFKVVKKSTGAIYFLNQVEVTAESKTYEFLIPQYIGLDQIGIENKWDVNANNGEGRWSKDFSCVIERIELIKDTSLLIPDFNVVSQTGSTYTVKKPAMQTTVYADINTNKVSFDSRSGIDIENNPFSAAYWEFADIDEYDKITITVKTEDTKDSEKAFVVKGYSPFNYPLDDTCKHSDYQSECVIEMECSEEPVTKTFSIDLESLKEGLGEYKIKAIEFENCSYDEYEDFDSWQNWTLEILEIKLEKRGAFSLSISVPQNQDIVVTPTEIKESNKVVGYTFTAADETYTSYEWKVNGEVQTEATGNTFTFNFKELPYGVYDITLLANDEQRHHSWQTQVTKYMN